MDLGPHAGFIIGAYIMATVVVAALVIWVAADHVVQKRALADLAEFSHWVRTLGSYKAWKP